ncbi:MAG: hypothetical protein IJJ15_04495 [Ruminococcus sp.]|nr:hypothetical protein [Ruminococcus sp.]
MNKFVVLKWGLLILIIAYIVSPWDLCPGPIDDIIIAIMGAIVERKLIIPRA